MCSLKFFIRILQELISERERERKKRDNGIENLTEGMINHLIYLALLDYWHK